MGYLPVQQSLDSAAANGLYDYSSGSGFSSFGVEGSSLDRGSPHLSSPQRSGERLSELETRSVSDDSSSTRITPQQHSEPQPKKNYNNGGVFADEHSLIAQYCQNLYNGDVTSIVPDSPMQMMDQINREQTQQIEHMIRQLETENANLQEEYDHLQTTNGGNAVGRAGGGGGLMQQPVNSDAQILSEAKMLREHKQKLESRMNVLEEHNQQLVSQLGKLKQYLQEVKKLVYLLGRPVLLHACICRQSPSSSSGSEFPGISSSAAAMITTNKTGTLNTKSVTASQLATNSPVLPPKMSVNGNGGHQTGNGQSRRQPPPALPPRGIPRPNGTTASNGKTPPAIPPKRSSLTRSDLALFDPSAMSNGPGGGGGGGGSARSHSATRRGAQDFFSNASNPRSRDLSLTRSGGNASWTDSLPRRDFYSRYVHSHPVITNPVKPKSLL